MIMRGSSPVRMSWIAVASCASITLCVTPSWARSTRVEDPLLHRDVSPELNVTVELPPAQSQAVGGPTGPGERSTSTAQSTLPPAHEARNELFAIREAFLEARKAGQALPPETVQALLDRAQQLTASLGLQAPSQATRSQPTTATQDDEARRQQDRGRIDQLLRANSESLRALREVSSGQAQQGIVALRPELQRSITADEAVRMALDRQLVGREVRLAYLDFVYAHQHVDAATESLRLASALVEGNRARVTAGTMAPIDVVQAQAEEARMRQQLVRAHNEMRVIELMLKRLTVGDVADPLWNTFLTPADGPSFRPTVEEVVSAATAEVQVQTWEETLKNAALKLQEKMDIRSSSEAHLAVQQELFGAGKSTIFQVVQAQRNLEVARHDELIAILEFRRAEIK